MRGCTILQVRLLAGNLRQRRFTARLIQFLETVEAIPTESEYLACLGHAPERLRELQLAELVLDNLLFLRHLTSPVSPWRGKDYVRSNRSYYK